MDKSQSKCKSCKHLKAIMSYCENGLIGDYICLANPNCWVKIDRLYQDDKFAECGNYEHYNELLIKDNSDVKIDRYDYNEEIEEIDCTKCGYFYTQSIAYPGGNCILRNDKPVGLGFYCDMFCKREEVPCMNTHITMDMIDMQKLFIEFDMLKKEMENKDE